jgi:hypothetical protein
MLRRGVPIAVSIVVFRRTPIPLQSASGAVLVSTRFLSVGEPEPEEKPIQGENTASIDEKLTGEDSLNSAAAAATVAATAAATAAAASTTSVPGQQQGGSLTHSGAGRSPTVTDPSQSNVPERYRILKATPDMPLGDLKIKYLLQCRVHHPEIGGDPDHFIRISEAYQQCLSDHGVIVEKGQGFNFGREGTIDAAEKQYLLSEKEKALLEFQENESLLIGDGRTKYAKQKFREENKKPFRETWHIYNLFFRRQRDKPTREVPEEYKSPDAEKMTKEEYELALKRGDDLLKREDASALAAATATDVMWNVKEAQVMKMSAFMMVMVFMAIGFVAFWSMFIYNKMKAQFEARPDMKSELATGTLLPWWGNDFEYERTVKRLFIDDYIRAKQGARRLQNFQEGAAREGMKEDAKKELDSSIFEVSEEKFKQLWANAEANARKTTPEPVLQNDKNMAPAFFENPRLFKPMMELPSPPLPR